MIAQRRSAEAAQNRAKALADDPDIAPRPSRPFWMR